MRSNLASLSSQFRICALIMMTGILRAQAVMAHQGSGTLAATASLLSARQQKTNTETAGESTFLGNRSWNCAFK